LDLVDLEWALCCSKAREVPPGLKLKAYGAKIENENIPKIGIHVLYITLNNFQVGGRYVF
jgi:hypothetical protein